MSKLRGAGPGNGAAPRDPELVEFASRTPAPPVDPQFRDELRIALWQLLLSLVTRLRGR